MIDISELDSCYKNFINNLDKLIPDSIITVDLNLLQDLDLLNFHHPGQFEPGVTRYFQLIEASDRITLINEQFFIWITSRRVEDTVSTFTLIALNQKDHPKLEMAFISSGVYNTSHLVMNVLEKFLLEIQENEDVLQGIKSKAK